MIVELIRGTDTERRVRSSLDGRVVKDRRSRLLEGFSTAQSESSGSSLVERKSLKQQLMEVRVMEEFVSELRERVRGGEELVGVL